MSAFVLVHGAWQGEWVWELVKPELESLGHTVITLDLPGSGDDNTPAKDITLDVYVNKVINVINGQNENVILVGHSMAGIIITQVAEYVPDKINKIVYLCAFLPKNGESLGEKTANIKGPVVTINQTNMTSELLPEHIEQTFFNAIEDKKIIKTALKRMRPQPMGPFQQKVSISEKNFGTVYRVYIETLLDNAVPIEFQRKMHTETACNKVITLNADHAPFYSKAAELVAHLHELN
jgi:triacylglycerol esterase/lipase EstA (alpha/beta hydrolase family)